MARLQGLVRDIQPYEDAGEGVLGIWSRLRLDQKRAPGVIKIAAEVRASQLLCVLAHELGHAATRSEDLELRGDLPDELRSEATADWYAYKWGFGPDIERWEKSRDWRHHGPRPGETYTETLGAKDYNYTLDEDFVGHLTITDAEPVSVKVVIRDDRKYCLLLKRSLGSKKDPGKWDLPGWGIVTEKSFDKAVVQKVAEETTLAVSSARFLGSVESAESQGKKVGHLVYEAQLESGETSLSAGYDEYVWVDGNDPRTMDLPCEFREFVMD